MACNCATNEQINLLYKQFGEKSDVSNLTSAKAKVKYGLQKIFAQISLIILMPFIICKILYIVVFGDNIISLANFFGFREKKVKTIRI